jgi:hypothetical protein
MSSGGFAARAQSATATSANASAQQGSTGSTGSSGGSGGSGGSEGGGGGSGGGGGGKWEGDANPTVRLRSTCEARINADTTAVEGLALVKT